MANIIMSVLVKDQDKFYQLSNNLPEMQFDPAQIHNAQQVWLIPEDNSNGSNIQSDYSTDPYLPNEIFAIKFTYGKNDGTTGENHTFWCSGSIGSMIVVENAALGGAASAYTVSPLSPFS